MKVKIIVSNGRIVGYRGFYVKSERDIIDKEFSKQHKKLPFPDGENTITVKGL